MSHKNTISKYSIECVYQHEIHKIKGNVHVISILTESTILFSVFYGYLKIAVYLNNWDISAISLSINQIPDKCFKYCIFAISLLNIILKEINEVLENERSVL